jgi:hypothetical protein
MVVDVDSMGLCRGALRESCARPTQTSRGDRARQSCHELAPAERRTRKRHHFFAAAHTTFERSALFAFVFFHATSSVAVPFRTFFLMSLTKNLDRLSTSDGAADKRARLLFRPTG